MEFTQRKAQGWYLDPYGLHQARWFSDGAATALVRDDGTESTDPPPATPFTGTLEPAPEVEGALLYESPGEGVSGDRAAWEVFVSTGGD
jgi:hypothetical protein